MGNFAGLMPGEVSAEEIISRGESGEFHEWTYEAFDTKEMGYEDVIGLLKEYKDRYVAAESEEERSRLVDEVLKIYRDRDIFPIQYYSEMGVLDEIERCIAYKAEFNGDTVSCVSGDTEYFNGRSWVRIDSYREGDMVMSYNVDGSATLVKPIRYISEKGIYTAYSYDSHYASSVQTSDHMSVVVNDGSVECECLGFTETGLEVGKVLQSTLAGSSSQLVKIPSGASYDGGDVISEEEALAIVTSVEEHNSFYPEELYGLDVESKKALLMCMVNSEGNLASEDTYVYEAKNRENLLFAASLAFFAGYSVNSVVEGDNVLVFSKDGYSCYAPSVFKKCQIEGKYCFEVPSHMLVLRHNGIPYITGNCGAGVGTTLCDFLFPNLYDTPSKHDLNKKGAETMFAKFHNDAYLRKSIEFCFNYKDGRPVPTSVMGGLRLVGSAPTNFRPMNAKAIYERFCPKGGVIYDYCCVDEDTEFFNGYEWKKISKYAEGEKVLQFDGNQSNSVSLVDPIEYIKYESKAPFYHFTSQGFESCQTGNHDVVLKTSEGDYVKVKQDEALCHYHYGEVPIQVSLSRLAEGKKSKYSYNYAWISAALFLTGTYENGFVSILVGEKLFETAYSSMNPLEVEKFTVERLKGGKMRISFNLCKEDSLLVEYDKVLCRFRFKQDVLDIFESAGCMYFVGRAVDEITASISSGVKYVESGFAVNTEREATFLQFCMSEYGSPVKVVNNGGSLYLVYVDKECCTYNTSSGGILVTEEKSWKYCFCVPSHMLVLRRGGCIYVTGNCGFGGRMLGALSSKNNYKYVGTDPNVETMYHLHQLGNYIEEVTGRENSYELHCCGSEVFRGKPNSIDFAFSSPPYFDLEVYSTDPTQCFNKFPVLEEWLEGYVRKTIQNIVYMLKPGRVYAVNIADFKVGGSTECAYVDEWIRISGEEGAPLFDTVYLGVTARAGSKEQAAGELKKENILIFKKPL